jgi:hypothetical protein
MCPRSEPALALQREAWERLWSWLLEPPEDDGAQPAPAQNRTADEIGPSPKGIDSPEAAPHAGAPIGRRSPCES